MDVSKIKKQLIDDGYDQVKVAVYGQHLQELWEQKNKDQQPKNQYWLKKVGNDKLVAIYKKVAIDDPLFIDGETISLGYRGGLKVNYQYQAYKNKLLITYPESVVDMDLVYTNDTRDFKKESGKVIYTHKKADPFAGDRGEIVGAYMVIKNRRGEFLETIDNEDIKKFRAVAQTDAIWRQWFDRMVLKSVIKRACKTHFFDSFKNIEELDNENYNLDQVNMVDREEVFKKIDQFDNYEDLLTWVESEEPRPFVKDQDFRAEVRSKLVELGYQFDEKQKKGKEANDGNQ